MERVQRNRHLTDAEAEKYAKLREQIAAELPELMEQARDATATHLSMEDFSEVQQIVAILHAERERQGLSLEEVARRTDLPTADLLALEQNRNCSPALSILTRIARSLGMRLMISVRRAEAYRENRPASTAVDVEHGG